MRIEGRKPVWPPARRAHSRLSLQRSGQSETDGPGHHSGAAKVHGRTLEGQAVAGSAEPETDRAGPQRLHCRQPFKGPAERHLRSLDWDSDNVSICKVYGGKDCEDDRTKPGDMFRLLRKFDEQRPPNSFKAYRIVEREFPGEVSAIWMYELEKNGLPGKKIMARAIGIWQRNLVQLLIPGH